MDVDEEKHEPSAAINADDVMEDLVTEMATLQIDTDATMQRLYELLQREQVDPDAFADLLHAAGARMYGSALLHCLDPSVPYQDIDLVMEHGRCKMFLHNMTHVLGVKMEYIEWHKDYTQTTNGLVCGVWSAQHAKTGRVWQIMATKVRPEHVVEAVDMDVARNSFDGRLIHVAAPDSITSRTIHSMYSGFPIYLDRLLRRVIRYAAKGYQFALQTPLPVLRECEDMPTFLDPLKYDECEVWSTIPEEARAKIRIPLQWVDKNKADVHVEGGATQMRYHPRRQVFVLDTRTFYWHSALIFLNVVMDSSGGRGGGRDQRFGRELEADGTPRENTRRTHARHPPGCGCGRGCLLRVTTQDGIQGIGRGGVERSVSRDSIRRH